MQGKRCPMTQHAWLLPYVVLSLLAIGAGVLSGYLRRGRPVRPLREAHNAMLREALKFISLRFKYDTEAALLRMKIPLLREMAGDQRFRQQALAVPMVMQFLGLAQVRRGDITARLRTLREQYEIELAYLESQLPLFDAHLEGLVRQAPEAPLLLALLAVLRLEDLEVMEVTEDPLQRYVRAFRRASHAVLPEIQILTQLLQTRGHYFPLGMNPEQMVHELDEASDNLPEEWHEVLALLFSQPRQLSV